MTPHCVKSISSHQFELAPIFMVSPSPGILEQHVYLSGLSAITCYFIFPLCCFLSISSLNSIVVIFFGLPSQESFFILNDFQWPFLYLLYFYLL